jgi:hypothetical protein
MDFLFKRLAELKAQKDDIDAEYDMLRTKLAETISADYAGPIKNEYGKFVLKAKTSYIYTDKVKKLEEKVKLEKVKEEQQGLAEKKITEYVTVSLNE